MFTTETYTQKKFKNVYLFYLQKVNTQNTIYELLL